MNFPISRAAGLENNYQKKIEELVREGEREQVSRASPGQRSQILKVEPRTQTQNGNGNGNQIYKIAGSTACVIRKASMPLVLRRPKCSAYFLHAS